MADGHSAKCEVIILNMRILNAVVNKRSDDIVNNMRIDDLKGFVCFIPSVIIGEPMIFMSSNTVWVRYRTTPIVSFSMDADSGTYNINTEDVSYEMQDLEKDQKRRKKRIVSTLYMESRILHNPLRQEKDPDGHLFADGRYRTKIFASDLCNALLDIEMGTSGSASFCAKTVTACFFASFHTLHLPSSMVTTASA